MSDMSQEDIFRAMHRLAKDLQDLVGDGCEAQWLTGTTEDRYVLRIRSKPGLTAYIHEVFARCRVAESTFLLMADRKRFSLQVPLAEALAESEASRARILAIKKLLDCGVCDDN